MTTVTYDEGSFLIDGRRIWLVSGSIHYFRVPPELWADRLLKAKRAGLNCVSTPVAWNFHEELENQWNLTGDRDVATFVRMAGELGLYVILRPGPFIGADWDFGGLPGWLAAKSGLSYRGTNAAYTHFFDKYFGHVLPRLAELQVTSGGNIVLIQNEHEYGLTTMPDRLNYLEFISQLFRRSGFDIPIVTCNDFTVPAVPDAVECVNAGADVIQKIKRLRVRQPHAPLLVTEYYCGGGDRWGAEHERGDAVETARRAMEILGCGAQYNYYMWHGGTNFGFWGARAATSHDAYQTTSYDYDAPLAEGGGITEKYYLTRLVNLTANHMGRYIAGAVMEDPGVSVHDSTSVLNVSGPAGRWAVVTNNGRRDIQTVRLSLPGGEELTVPLGLLGAAAVPVGVRLDTTVTLDYANLTPLGFFGHGQLVLHGPAGCEGLVSINGEEIRSRVPSGREPLVIDHGELQVVLINSELAMRTWVVEETLVFGPDFVGEDLDEVCPAPKSRQYALLGADGKLTHKKVKPAAHPSPAAPRLGTWTRIAVCTEPVSDDLEWHKTDRPRDVDRLGCHHGYLWYRIEMDRDRARKHNLYLGDCADRATIYVNGEYAGTWGCGEGAAREPISMAFDKGQNTITVLLDNLGRVCGGSRLGEAKGLCGHIHDAKLLRPKKFKLAEEETFSKRIVPRQLSHMIEELEKTQTWSAQTDISLSTVTPVQISFTDVPHHLAILCNDRVAGFFAKEGTNYGELTLGAELQKGRNHIKFLLWGDVRPQVMDQFAFHALLEGISEEAVWQFRPLEMPRREGPVVGKDRPAWYAARFKYTPCEKPLFLTILGARKGQIFLNHHNVGRFWTIGPQHCYYLPQCWLAEENELLIFEESGRIPSKSRLTFRPRGPFRD